MHADGGGARAAGLAFGAAVRTAEELARDYAFAFDRRFASARTGGAAGELAAGTGRPVLLLPGVYETWHFLDAIARRLAEDGRPVHVVEALAYNSRPIAASAALAQAYLRERDVGDVTIVAHSKGGLIGKHMMAIDDVEHRIARMIAICTPFAGSPLAPFAPVPSLREFRARNETLRRLAREREVNARILAISTRFDQYLGHGRPLEGAENVVLPVLGHFRVLAEPTLLELVAARA